MEIFDEKPGFVYLEDIEYSTLINEAESGKEKRRNKWPEGCAKRTFKLTYKTITQTRYSSILQFFNDRSGMKEAFYWENFNESPVLKIYPSGITVDADYQGQDTTNLRHYPIISGSETIYDDAVALTRGVHYSIVDLTGEITWIIKPSNGSVITADYRFYRVVRFDNDKLSPERIAFEKYNLELLLKEIEPRM
ncbi:MAG: DUF2460 domain-containing protein [Candidatus Omnitrophica bacterium]|nr:DUF2460 domain-containing protein [Candidatus Omnitrophota bacterium]